MSKPSDFVQGTLDVLLLKILALEPLHGWAISQRLTAVSGEVLFADAEWAEGAGEGVGEVGPAVGCGVAGAAA
jgi:hypothetical protein